MRVGKAGHHDSHQYTYITINIVHIVAKSKIVHKGTIFFANMQEQEQKKSRTTKKKAVITTAIFP
jgi:hypothetical protein